MDIDSLIIKTKKEVFSNSAGIYGSKRRGEGYDFLELEEYDYTSDAKKIDWLISAKMQKPYVKVTQDEKRRNIVAVFLLSGSLFFGSGRLKIETLLEAFSILGFSAFRGGDIFRGGYILEKEIFLSLPYLDLFLLQEDIKRISKISLLGKRGEFGRLNDLFYMIKEKSFVVFLGDFSYEIDLSLFAAKHEVLAVVARDGVERGSRMDEEVELVDNESLREGSYLLNDFSLRKYGERMDERLWRNYEAFGKVGIDYLEIFDYDRVFLKLYNYFLGK
ncbi:MAG: DUF58 domain-containing protein [Epsilonproteobacteria bacterium]|nr:DUF58 domain-containing protein [Campylobacterota bacterium]